MHEYINEGFFKKEALLFEALENNGFPADEGPIGAMYDEQKKGRNSADHMLSAAKSWQDGDEEARGEVGWAASEYTTTLRQHLGRLKNLIFPLLDQNLSPEDEQKISVGLNTIAFEKNLTEDSTKYVDLIVTLEDELAEWK
jgi:hemerythrin-like domain-containing protein